MPALVMAFGTFDILHPGHLSYLRQSKKLGSSLVVVVARDSSVKRIKGRPPVYSEKERLALVSELKFVDRAILGSASEKDMFSAIRRLKPSFIALGYDQKPSNKELKKKLAAMGISSAVRRMHPYKPHMHKSSVIRGRVCGKDKN
jgi:FAD synthetase